jgi:SAM-dependent methyltransferase
MSEDRYDGYVQGLDYTHRYCPEMAPARLALACVARGFPALPTDRPLRYLELAFGQGVSVNVHAAAHGGEFWGIDINPAHVANARNLAEAAGAGARLLEDSFAEFAVRDDTPLFDVIAMHGTWSWISRENRDRVVEILRRKLAPGGVCYVSYNCLPGWAAEMPLRHLLTLHANEIAPDSQPLKERIDASLAFAQTLLDADAGYFRAHPGLPAWLGKMQTQDHRYLAHEYFNRDWHPMPSSEVARELSVADLAFAASSSLAGQSDGLGLPQKMRDLLAGISRPVLRETAFDYLVNQRFRRDLFVKDRRRLLPEERIEQLRDTAFTLLQHPNHVPARARFAGHEMDLLENEYVTFLEALAKNNFSPKTLRQLERDPDCDGMPLDRLIEAALVLTEVGSVHPAQPKGKIEEAASRCRSLNNRILERAETSGDIAALACPVTGAGVFADRREMLFLRAISKGVSSGNDWAKFAWEKMGAGDPASLRADAQAFAKFRLPVLKALRVA